MAEALTTYPSLRSRHILITGGASGIGATLVDGFCAQGSVVSFLDIDDAQAETTIERNQDRGVSVPDYQHCDLTDIAALQAAITRAIERHGPVRALVNNAANDARHDWAKVTSEDWDRQMAVNLKHQFFAIQAVAGPMAEAGGGSIVNMSSISWQLGMGGLPAYVTAKAGIIGLTRSFARDLGPQNIRVNTVLPGWILTEKQIDRYLTPEVEVKLLQDQCLKRRLVPEDMAPMILFLASDDSSACTSQCFTVDGGRV